MSEAESTEFIVKKSLAMVRADQALFRFFSTPLPCTFLIFAPFYCFAACKRKDDSPEQHQPAPKKPRLVFTDLQRRTLQAIFKVTFACALDDTLNYHSQDAVSVAVAS